LITKTQIGLHAPRLQKKSRTTYLLRSALPQNIELIDSINQLMHAIKTEYAIKVDLVHCGFEKTDCLKEQDRISIYLVVKAQIKNILKAATASSVAIHLAKNHDQVAIVIEDNGAGVDINKLKNTRAVRTIQNLVRYHKGQYSLISDHGKTVLQLLIHVTNIE
jgi:glucose-6-phosphate-specific signal transduction histidine kinase